MTTFSSVESYIESFENPTKRYLLELRNLIRSVIPDTTELINYNIPAFTLVEGGKREEQIMMAGYKNHIGLYPHPTTMSYFWDKLEGYKKAKGSVQFPLDQPLPKDLIREMVRYRLWLVNG